MDGLLRESNWIDTNASWVSLSSDLSLSLSRVCSFYLNDFLFWWEVNIRIERWNGNGIDANAVLQKGHGHQKRQQHNRRRRRRSHRRHLLYVCRSFWFESQTELWIDRVLTFLFFFLDTIHYTSFQEDDWWVSSPQPEKEIKDEDTTKNEGSLPLHTQKVFCNRGLEFWTASRHAWRKAGPVNAPARQSQPLSRRDREQVQVLLRTRIGPHPLPQVIALSEMVEVYNFLWNEDESDAWCMARKPGYGSFLRNYSLIRQQTTYSK